MLERERRPTSLLTASDELRKLVIENPDLPLLIFAGEDCNTGDYCYTTCSDCHAELGEFLDCMQEVKDERVYTAREDFQADLEDNYYDFDGSDKEFEQFIENRMMEYEPYWRKCIILYVDN